MDTDTIVAISTPPGRGAIGILRLSGPSALQIAMNVFHLRATGNGQRATLQPRHAHFGSLIDPGTNEKLDDGILIYYPAPHSYTGEDVVEISLHGNPVLLERALKVLCRGGASHGRRGTPPDRPTTMGDDRGRGARPALPGEFTKRAFLNGKLDLSQAEGVAELIAAHSEAGLRAAARLKEGRLSQEIGALRRSITDILAHTEAVIDFAEEEDVQAKAFTDIAARLDETARRIGSLLTAYHTFRRLKEGAVTAIVGEPNVGKSSLMNRLAGRDASIVHPTPGTTRDVVREWIEIEGVPVDLRDTAGLRSLDFDFPLPTPHSPLTIEAAGISKTLTLLHDADLVLWVLDAQRPVAPLTTGPLVHFPSLLFVLNKIDLGLTADISSLHSLFTGSRITDHGSRLPFIPVSALTGEGIDDLRRKIGAILSERFTSAGEMPLLRNRHASILRSVLEKIDEASSLVARGEPPDLIAVGLKEAAAELSEITGEITTEDLLDRVFSDFCVGK